MKVLLVALLALGSGLTAAATTIGHEPAPRHSAQQFELTLTTAALREGGHVDLSDANCVVIRAAGEAAILDGSAILAPAEERSPGPGRLRLEAAGPRAGLAQVIGGLPLRLELADVAFASSRDAAHVGVRLPEGALGLAAEQRFTLTLDIVHAGAPLRYAVDACPDGSDAR